MIYVYTDRYIYLMKKEMGRIRKCSMTLFD